jgi:ankyrin repeat protein
MKTRLLRAIGTHKDPALAKQILRSNPSQIFSFDEEGKSPLHKAVEMGDKDLCDFLLVWGASPNAKDQMGHTPLHSAIIFRQFRIAKLLVLSNAFVNAASNTGRTPLHFLADHSEDLEVLEMADFLLSHGAHPRKKEQSNSSAIDKAEKIGSLGLRETLQSAHN